MNELTSEPMSRGIFGMAKTILQLRPGVEQVEQAIEDKTAELATIEQRIGQAMAYERALAQHVEELGARLQDARSELPEATRDLEERLVSMRAAVNALQDEQARLQYGIGEAHRQERDAREQVRYLAGQAAELGKIPSIRMEQQLARADETIARLADENRLLREQLAAAEGPAAEGVPDDKL